MRIGAHDMVRTSCSRVRQLANTPITADLLLGLPNNGEGVVCVQRGRHARADLAPPGRHSLAARRPPKGQAAVAESMYPQSAHSRPSPGKSRWGAPAATSAVSAWPPLGVASVFAPHSDHPLGRADSPGDQRRPGRVRRGAMLWLARRPVRPRPEPAPHAESQVHDRHRARQQAIETKKALAPMQ